MIIAYIISTPFTSDRCAFYSPGSFVIFVLYKVLMMNKTTRREIPSAQYCTTKTTLESRWEEYVCL